MSFLTNANQQPERAVLANRGKVIWWQKPVIVLAMILLLVIVALQIQLQEIALQNHLKTQNFEELTLEHNLNQLATAPSSRKGKREWSSSSQATELQRILQMNKITAQDENLYGGNDGMQKQRPKVISKQQLTKQTENHSLEKHYHHHRIRHPHHQDNAHHDHQHHDYHAHVLYGFSGNAPGMMDEFEISLKSVLMNAPISFPLTIHIMVDDDAYQALPGIFESAELDQWHTLHPITLRIYQVEKHLDDWESFVIQETHNTRMTERHKIGAYFRLFADRVINDRITGEVVDHMLYMDTDVIVMANLENLWTSHVPSQQYFKWGKKKCSGFLLLRISKIPNIWRKLHDLIHPDSDKDVKKQSSSKDDLLQQYKIKSHGFLGDQILFQIIADQYPKQVGRLEKEWDVTVSDLWSNVHQKRRNGVGMLHFNGSGSNATGSAFRSGIITSSREEKRTTWGLADYYVRIPWSWAKFQASSLIPTADNDRGGESGHSLRIITHE